MCQNDRVLAPVMLMYRMSRLTSWSRLLCWSCRYNRRIVMTAQMRPSVSSTQRFDRPIGPVRVDKTAAMSILRDLTFNYYQKADIFVHQSPKYASRATTCKNMWHIFQFFRDISDLPAKLGSMIWKLYLTKAHVSIYGLHFTIQGR